MTATGKPKLVRGTSATMTAVKLWCELDPQKDDLKTAHGDERVVIDDEDEKNGHIHATGDHVTYDQPSGVLTMTGHIHATQKLKDQPEPRTLTGGEFVYNTKTKGWSVRRAPGERVQAVYPQPPKPGNGGAPGAQPTPGAAAPHTK